MKSPVREREKTRRVFVDLDIVSLRTGLDCSLWPKLQHVRVAMEYIRRLYIPTDFTTLWRYLGNDWFIEPFVRSETSGAVLGAAYTLDAFTKSCPSDQEIVLHWIRRETSPKEYLQLTKEEPKYSFDVPSLD